MSCPKNWANRKKDSTWWLSTTCLWEHLCNKHITFEHNIHLLGSIMTQPQPRRSMHVDKYIYHQAAAAGNCKLCSTLCNSTLDTVQPLNSWFRFSGPYYILAILSYSMVQFLFCMPISSSRVLQFFNAHTHFLSDPNSEKNAGSVQQFIVQLLLSRRGEIETPCLLFMAWMLGNTLHFASFWRRFGLSPERMSVLYLFCVRCMLCVRKVCVLMCALSVVSVCVLSVCLVCA